MKDLKDGKIHNILQNQQASVSVLVRMCLQWRPSFTSIMLNCMDTCYKILSTHRTAPGNKRTTNACSVQVVSAAERHEMCTASLYADKSLSVVIICDQFYKKYLLNKPHKHPTQTCRSTKVFSRNGSHDINRNFIRDEMDQSVSVFQIS